jgi:uncharacterized membrane protein YedE/YeeE
MPYITDFTPLAALGGGVFIGLAASLLILGAGKVAGISGILGGLLRHEAGDVAWRWAFVAGLAAAPLAFAWAWPLGRPHMEAMPLVLMLGGVLVGFGTRLGGGCTSGHGVCGLARLSPRSFVATGVFVATAVVTVFVVRHVVGPW